MCSVSPPGPFPFICPNYLDGHVFNKKNGVWRHVCGPCALRGSMIFLGNAAVFPSREMNGSHHPSVFTPAGGALIAPSVHHAAGGRPDGSVAQDRCWGGWSWTVGRKMSGERWNLGPRRCCSRCSRMTQPDPAEGGRGFWNSLLGSPLGRPCRVHMCALCS